jgi:hypothetical protein
MIRLKIRNYKYWFLSGALMFMATTVAMSQNTFQNCKDVFTNTSENIAYDEIMGELANNVLPIVSCANRQLLEPPSSQTVTVGTFSKYLTRNQISMRGMVASIREPMGSDVVADQESEVVRVNKNVDGNYDVLTTSGGSVSTYYGGLTDVSLTKGVALKSGDLIGKVNTFDRNGEPFYRLARMVPSQIFSGRSQSVFRRIEPEQVALRIEGWRTGYVQVWIDGVYIAEMNKLNNFDIEISGLRNGQHFVKLFGFGAGERPDVSVYLSINGKRQATSVWRNDTINSFIWSL